MIKYNNNVTDQQNMRGNDDINKIAKEAVDKFNVDYVILENVETTNALMYLLVDALSSLSNNKNRDFDVIITDTLKKCVEKYEITGRTKRVVTDLLKCTMLRYIDSLKDYENALFGEEQAVVNQAEKPKNKCCVCFNKKECCICFNKTDQKKACVPCGHTLYCNDCVTKIKSCSICNVKIDQVIDIYN